LSVQDLPGLAGMKDKSDAQETRIAVQKDGPYLVTGKVPISVQVITADDEGFSWDWVEGESLPAKSPMSLCRCGQSGTKPFCDGTHKKIKFNGKETASHATVASQSDTFDGPDLTLSDAEKLCAFARFCDPAGKIWALIERTDEPEIRELVIREAMHCPSGRLVLTDKETDDEIEEAVPLSIGVVEDPALKCSGPLWIRGGIAIESADGTRYEKRNRVTLCRCGASSNKPFCDGSHASIMFNDGMVPKE
jgi:CDGSH-type Zn-finger protein